jgi:hypothetical protein
MDSDSLTSRNNALMCLTDLIEVYPLAKIYLESVLEKIIEVISKEKVTLVISSFKMYTLLIFRECSAESL